MDAYIDAFQHIDTLIRENNARLFHAAHIGHEKIKQRGALIGMYTQISDVYDAAGMASIAYRPHQIVRAEDGDEVAEYCDEYDPEKQFVISISIGQDNNPHLPVIRNTQIVDYIGKEKEQEEKAMNMTLTEMHSRLVGQKSWRCDWCAQKWRVDKLRRDPFVQKLVFCPDKEECWKDGLRENFHLIQWYRKNIDAFNVEGMSQAEIQKHLPQLNVAQEGNEKEFEAHR